MSLRIGAAITDGLRRVLNRNGLIFILILAVLGLIWQITFNSMFVQLLPGDVPGSFGPTVELPLGILGAGAVMIFLILSYITIVAIRTFVAGEATQIPGEFLRRNIPWVLANFIVGGLVFSILLFIGTVLLVIPGIIVYLSLIFMTIIIVVDDVNFITAMQHSWRLTRGNWIRLFVFLLIVVVPIMVFFGLLSAVLSIALGPNSMASQVISGLISMPMSIIMLGILAGAFVQLRNEPT